MCKWFFMITCFAVQAWPAEITRLPLLITQSIVNTWLLFQVKLVTRSSSTCLTVRLKRYYHTSVDVWLRTKEYWPRWRRRNALCVRKYCAVSWRLTGFTLHRNQPSACIKQREWKVCVEDCEYDQSRPGYVNAVLRAPSDSLLTQFRLGGPILVIYVSLSKNYTAVTTTNPLIKYIFIITVNCHIRMTTFTLYLIFIVWFRFINHLLTLTYLFTYLLSWG